MQGVAKGNPAALEELVRRFRKEVVLHASRIVGADAAEDVAQEVFVRVWTRSAGWQSTGSARAYIYRTTRNLSLNRKRSDISRSEFAARFERESARGNPTPADDLERDELWRRIARAIRHLPPRRREVLVRARLQRRSYSEIATAMAISPQTVANHLTRATADLRKLFGEQR